MKSSLRQSVKSYLKEGKLYGDKDIVFEFLKYLEAYCAEMKKTEYDVLDKDDVWDEVFHLFDNIILKSKPQLLA